MFVVMFKFVFFMNSEVYIGKYFVVVDDWFQLCFGNSQYIYVCSEDLQFVDFVDNVLSVYIKVIYIQLWFYGFDMSC